MGASGGWRSPMWVLVEREVPHGGAGGGGRSLHEDDGREGGPHMVMLVGEGGLA